MKIPGLNRPKTGNRLIPLSAGIVRLYNTAILVEIISGTKRIVIVD
jgi:hypothetical protein